MMSLGEYPEVGLKEARARHAEVRKLWSGGCGRQESLGPGIEVTLPAGCGMPIIDGNHRAARALAEGKEFLVYVLSESETLELLRRSMGTSVADHYWKRMAASKPHPDDLNQGDQQ